MAEGLQYRDFLTVGLLVNKAGMNREPLLDNWIYIQDGDVRVGRVQIFNNWSPEYGGRSREHGRLGLEYFVNEGGDLWVKPDPQMIALGIAELEKIGFLQRGDVLDALCSADAKKRIPHTWGAMTSCPPFETFAPPF